MEGDKFTAFLDGLKGLIAEAEGDTGEGNSEGDATQNLPEGSAEESQPAPEEQAPPMPPKGGASDALGKFMSKPKPNM